MALESQNGGNHPEKLGETDEQQIHELLNLLPADVREELNQNTIDHADPAFINGLLDHLSRLSIADPQKAQRVLGQVIRLKKRMMRALAEEGEEVPTVTVRHSGMRVGRNDPCPCGSGNKFKKCCSKKH